MPEDAFFANQPPPENTASVASGQPSRTQAALTKKAAALDAAASSKRCSRQATRQLWSPPLDEPDPHEGVDDSGVAQLGAGAGAGSGSAIAGSALGAAGRAPAFFFFPGVFLWGFSAARLHL